ncbi:Inositol-1-monophosphatase [Arsenophonus endosymbiont of Aleurodicus dispersus]|uniref:inositol-1-monophosphatase n=1 Tax=Arsenophonus endosymbiont of Aleurodicus dispersus TaxID=235559 RepID=UPI000EB58031|nr:inositol-1-monophosphatase [Arsenophonus endosymbiont of Aleurodicus dispersus]VAY02337.1 Inositol-1-monophosphatase [Arsenophonus endosymbiont of Aleurodicus dispersus]
MHPMLTIAIRAARQAGSFFAKSYERFDIIEIMAKGENNLLTNIAKKAEQIIIEVIHKFYPTHSILSEERGQILSEKNDIQWIIYPLDGITNFTKRLPHFAVSIAVRINGRTEVSAIYNPMLNELFTAVRGQGAQLNGYRLRIKNNNELEGAIIATGFPFKAKQHLAAYINIIAKLFNKCSDFRRAGSAALDLAYVAASRIDAFFEIGLKPWDFMAGELLVREAGGVVTNFGGGYNYLTSGNLLVGSTRIVKKIVPEMQTELSDPLNI